MVKVRIFFEVKEEIYGEDMWEEANTILSDLAESVGQEMIMPGEARRIADNNGNMIGRIDIEE